jgi:hypothetical protein
MLESLDIRLLPLAGGWAIDLTLPERASLCGRNGEPLQTASCYGATTHRLLVLIDEAPTLKLPARPAAPVVRLTRSTKAKDNAAIARKR